MCPFAVLVLLQVQTVLKKLAAHETEGEKVQAQLDEYGAGLWEGPVALDVYYIDSIVYTCPFV